jgi:hypothetical protein
MRRGSPSVPAWLFLPPFRTRIGNNGIFVCWDTLFPEVARIYAIQGADLLAVATNREDPYASQWDFMTSARAELNLAEARRLRVEYWTRLKNRRPDTYALLSQSYLTPGG